MVLSMECVRSKSGLYLSQQFHCIAYMVKRAITSGMFLCQLKKKQLQKNVLE